MLATAKLLTIKKLCQPCGFPTGGSFVSQGRPMLYTTRINRGQEQNREKEKKMKKIIFGLICLVVIGGCESSGQARSGVKLSDIFAAASDAMGRTNKNIVRGSVATQDNPYINGPITTDGSNIGINTYGYGVHSNRFGQPIKLRPDFGYVSGEKLHIQEDAYGLGVHSDQYGRPVREYPWP